MISQKCVVASFFILFSHFAAATDKCSDVLANGTYKYSHYSTNTYLQQVLVTTLASMTFQQAKRERQFGMDVPLGEFMLGANFSEAEFNRFAESVNRTFRSTTVYNNRMDVALASGDDTIVSAWKSCMQRTQKEVLTVRWLRGADPKRPVAIVQWWPGARTPFAVLTEDVELPEGVRVTSGSTYLKKGARLTSEERRIEFQVPDARTALTLTIQADLGSDTAYLPPRIRPQVQRVAYLVNAHGRYDAAGTAPSVSIHVENGKTPSATAIFSVPPDGWGFELPITKSPTLPSPGYEGAACFPTSTENRDSLTLTVWGPGNPSRDYGCTFKAAPWISRTIWVPEDSTDVVGTPSAATSPSQSQPQNIRHLILEPAAK